MLFWCLAVCARGHEDILLEECLWGELSVEDHWDHSQLFLSVCKYILYLCVEEQDRERTNESVTLRAWSLAVLMLPMFRFFAAIQSKHAFTKLGWMDFGNVIWCLFLTETLFLSFFFYMSCIPCCGLWKSGKHKLSLSLSHIASSVSTLTRGNEREGMGHYVNANSTVKSWQPLIVNRAGNWWVTAASVDRLSQDDCKPYLWTCEIHGVCGSN